MGFRRSLALLVIGTLAPLLVFSAVAVYQYDRERNAAAEQSLLDASRGLVVALDRHLDATITALVVLGSSEHLDTSNLGAFHRQCVLALEAREEWRAISLFDASGRRLLITAEPFGTALPGPPPVMSEPFRRLVEGRKPNVSNLFESPLTKRHAVSVGVPIMRAGEVRWVISAGLNPEVIGKLVTEQRVLSNWTATILDREHRVVAGARGGARIGEPAPPRLVETVRSVAEGTFRGPVAEGTPALTAFSRSPTFGWTATITVPLAGGVFGQPVRAILGAGAALLLLGLVVAVAAGRRISRPVEALARAAQQMGRGESVKPVESGVTEIAALSAALVGASRDHASAEAERAKYGERLDILHEIDRLIISGAAPLTIAEAVLRRLRDLLGVPRAIVNLFDLEKGEVEWLAAVGRRRFHLGPGVRYPLSLAGDLDSLKRGEPQIVDVSALPPSIDSQALLASDVRVYMVVPMVAHGELIGSVSFGGPTGEFPPEQVGIAREAATQLAIAIAQSRLQEKVERHAADLEDQVRARTAALEAAREELVRKERLATLGQLAGSVAHELRNPLGVIKNSVYYLRMRGAEDERTARHLAILEREVATSNRIITELLDFARVPDSRPIATSLNQIVSEYFERNGATPDGVQSVLQLTSESSELQADPHQLTLILGNLVRNAEQAMADNGGGRLTVETVRQADGTLELAVSDTGGGIPREEFERIFEPLYTTKAKGFGLGLPIVKQLTTLNRGDVEVESEVGRGSRFSLRFPPSS
jgi:signal transduction histidine kinase/HAMP domain-containing protein